MDPDRLTPTPPAPLDDGALAAIVRDVTDDWRMPPQRLGEATWRDRIGRPRRSGGGGSGIRWSRRLFGAATLAIVATISLSLGAVWLTGPRGDQGASVPSAGSSPSASSSIAPTATPLPKLALAGAPPQPTTIMVTSDDRYRVADLANGDLGPTTIGPYTGPTTVMTRPGGGWVCVCGDWTQLKAGGPNGLRLTLDVVDATGASIEQRVLKELTGTYDPNANASMQPQIVDASVTATPDGRSALIGWSQRDGAAGWNVGVDVLDLATLENAGSYSVNIAEPASKDGHPRTRTAPVASLSPSGRTLLLSSSWYVDDVNDPNPEGGTDHWTMPFDATPRGSRLGGVTIPIPAGSSVNTDCGEYDAGLIDDARYYTICYAPAGGLEVARVAKDGTVIDTTRLPSDVNAFGAALTTRNADALFLWNAVSATMTRFDFGTAAITTGTGIAVTRGDATDVLAAVGRQLGHWLAPSAYAKVFLDPGVVLSADGSRVYGLGVGGSDGAGGSTGVFAFDPATLDLLARYPAQTDMSSMAVTADGRFVYAAAAAGVAADGSDAPANGASITVYDTTDGSVRLLAGQLPTTFLALPEPILR